MAGLTVATFNVENLFARPRAFHSADWSVGEPVLTAYEKFNALIANSAYSDRDRDRLRDLLVDLDVYHVNQHGAVRRRVTTSPRWAWLRKNRGSFDSQPRDPSQDVRITATGRGAWIGWVELVAETTDEIGTRMTGQVITDVDADVLAVIEAEDRPALVRFNQDLLGGLYRHVMLVDGNDSRGIDVGIMTKDGFPIRSIRSHVDTADAVGTVFSRDCADYEVHTPSGQVLHVLVNHFKSQSGGGDDKRRRQAEQVRRLTDELVAQGQHVVVLGDLNEGQPNPADPPPNLTALFAPDGPLRSCYDLDGFDPGPRPGTYDACGLRDRLDYILVSTSLQAAVTGGRVVRRGLWGSRRTRPTGWDTYPEITAAAHQASDHAAVALDLDL